MSEEKLELKVLSTRTHSLYYMVECLMGLPHRSPEMASNFSGRVGNWFPVRQALDNWEESYSSEELSLLRFPGPHGQSQTLSQVLERVALQSENAEDFANRVEPWVGSEAGENLRKVMTVMEPLYEQYWWSGPGLNGRVDELKASLEKGDFQTNFTKAMSFYDGKLHSNEATVALIPYRRGIIDDEARTRGHNSGNLQVFEVVLDRANDGIAGVCFHEFLHGVWEGQSAEESARWRQAFEKRGLQGRLAYAQLNEGLATALGNGWFQAQIDGQVSQKDWYADPVINAYAKALYPVVKKAVEEARPPSDDELQAMAMTFENALPNADSTFDVVAAQFLTVTSRQEAHLAPYQSGLMKLGPVRSSSVRDWDDKKARTQTFVLFWATEDGARIGEASPDDYSLRKTESGWELRFDGNQDELFTLLRRFQKEGLKEKR